MRWPTCRCHVAVSGCESSVLPNLGSCLHAVRAASQQASVLKRRSRAPVFDVIAPQFAGHRLAQARVVVAVLQRGPRRNLERRRLRMWLVAARWRGCGGVAGHHGGGGGCQPPRGASAPGARKSRCCRACRGEQQYQAEGDLPSPRELTTCGGYPATVGHPRTGQMLLLTSEAAWNCAGRRSLRQAKYPRG